jgi:hypothetical protein
MKYRRMSHITQEPIHCHELYSLLPQIDQDKLSKMRYHWYIMSQLTAMSHSDTDEQYKQEHIVADRNT